MKRLNRKGFTLVELLAVIIILAIVVGITIPAVLTTTKKAKEKTYITAADNTADWFDRQYQAITTGTGSLGMTKVDGHFTDACGTDASLCTSDTGFTFDLNDADATKAQIAKKLVASSGLQIGDIDSMYVKIDKGTGRTCIILTASSNGDYYGLVANDQVKSSTCS